MAIKFYSDSLKIYEVNYGIGSIEQANILNDLGEIFMK